MVDYSSCTTHISNTMQGFLPIQTINPNEKYVFMGNQVKALVEAIGSYCLILDTGHHLDLFHMVLKTRPDRPVRPVGPPGPTGWTAGRSRFRFGPVIRPDGDQTGIGPLESAVQPVNRTNRPVQ